MQCKRTRRTQSFRNALIVAALWSVFFPAPVCADAELGTASAPLNYYAPVPTFHDRIHHKLGVIVSYIVGPEYTQAVIYDSGSREWQLVVSGSFTIEGRRLRCEQAPDRSAEPADIFCPDWPDDIDLYSTPVIFSYWTTRLGNNEIAILQSIEPAPAAATR